MTLRHLKQQRFLLTTMILLLTFLVSACSGQPAAPVTQIPTQSPIVLTDAAGKTIKLDKPAQKVISLAPSNTELLFAVGAGKQVVGRDAFSDFPTDAQSLPDVGGGFGALNTEIIVSLGADLALAADITPPEQIQALEELGLTVFSLPNPDNFEEMYENLRTVASLTGHIAEANTLIETLSARVESVKKKVAGATEKPLVFYELDATDANAPYTSGPGTFIDLLISSAGGENLGSTLDSAWVQVSIEELLTRAPDMIILGDFTWGGVTPEAVAARAGWDALEAVKTNNVFTIDDNLISRPGPRLVDGLEAIARIIHPDLFK